MKKGTEILDFVLNARILKEGEYEFLPALEKTKKLLFGIE
jgi:hypothetical protein